MVPRRICRSTLCTAVKPRNSFVSPRVSRIRSLKRKAFGAGRDRYCFRCVATLMRGCDEGNRQQPTSCRAILQWDRGFESVFPQRRLVQTIGSSAVEPRGVSALQILGRFPRVVHGIALGHPNVREPKSAGTGRTYVKTKSI